MKRILIEKEPRKTDINKIKETVRKIIQNQELKQIREQFEIEGNEDIFIVKRISKND